MVYQNPKLGKNLYFSGVLNGVNLFFTLIISTHFFKHIAKLVKLPQVERQGPQDLLWIINLL
jgi:hypothetical protein